ncbi:MAG: CrcB family protein, partial [Deltaproteobacteria bacterium]|nr:CrcB family protein [Deltaproteobacteria bacterium]
LSIYGTLSANVVGSFVIGAVAALALSSRWFALPTVQLALTTGLLGGFTTFSAFSLDTLRFAQRGDFTQAVMYAFGTLLLCIMAVALGFFVIRAAS